MKIELNSLKSRYDDLETSLIKKLLQYILPYEIREKILNFWLKNILSKNGNFLRNYTLTQII